MTGVAVSYDFKELFGSAKVRAWGFGGFRGCEFGGFVGLGFGVLGVMTIRSSLEAPR